MSPLPSPFFPLSFFSPQFFLFLCFSPFTDAIVAVEFTKEDIDSFSRLGLNKEEALVLSVGDVITDVKLVCS